MLGIKLNSVATRLIMMRGLRSVWQGALVVDLTLYLKNLNWSGPSIGGVTTASSLFGALLILVVGVLSDRLDRKPFLLIYEILTLFSAIAASISSQVYILILAIVFASFGRGQTGAAGPFSPAEQAWLANNVDKKDRGKVFSINMATGFFGMALGAMIGGIPSLIKTNEPISIGQYFYSWW